MPLLIATKTPDATTTIINLVGSDEWWQVFPNGQAFRLLPLQPEPTQCKRWWRIVCLYPNRRTGHYENGEVLHWTNCEKRADMIMKEFADLGVTCETRVMPPQEGETNAVSILDDGSFIHRVVSPADETEGQEQESGGTDGERSSRG